MTVDFDTLEDNAVTIRERDTMKQERIPLDGRACLVRRAPGRLLRPDGAGRSHRRMPTKHPADGHNVRVIETRPSPRARTALVALLLALALVLTALRQPTAEKKPTAEPSVDLPTGDVEVPEGVTLTEAGTELAFGETATVAYEPNTQTSSVLELTVDSVQTGQDRGPRRPTTSTPHEKRSHALLRARRG